MTPDVSRVFEERTERAFADISAYDREEQATRLGRQAFRDRQRAQHTLMQGDVETAYRILAEIEARFAPEDHSAAASAARHDLAHVLSNRVGGVARENHLRAEALCRQALKSAARTSRPCKRMETKSLLANQLRWLSRGAAEEYAAPRLDEAQDLLDQAISDARSCGLAGLEALARFCSNLGNLHDERGQFDRAAAAHERGLQALDEFERLGFANQTPHFPELLAKALNNAAQTMLKLASGGVPGRAVNYLDRAIALNVDPASTTARVSLALCLAAGNPVERRRAEGLLKKAALNRMHDGAAVIAVDAWKRLSRPDEARRFLDELLRQKVAVRAQQSTDHSAAASMESAQHLAALAAGLDLDANRPVDAFLILENHSGMNFAEHAARFSWRPQSEEERAAKLVAIDQLGNSVAILGQILGQLVYTNEEELVSALRTYAAQAYRFPSPARTIVELAASSHRPLHALEIAHDELYPLAAVAQRELDQLCPNVRELVERPLDMKGVDAIVREASGRVLLHIALDFDAKQLMAIGLWHEQASGLCARWVRIPWRSEYWSIGQRGSNTSLDAVDLSGALPEGELRDVYVRCDAYLASLPVLAFGPTGRRLVDRAEAVLHLPSLIPLRMRQAPTHGRTGTVYAQSTDLSNQTLEQTSSGELVRRADELLARAHDADVVSIFAHGLDSDDPEAPGIVLDDRAITVGDADHRWLGLERIEFFACGSGVPVPSNPLEPVTADAHGLDMEFLKVGARSAVGSLWPIPIVATSKIVNRYRRSLSAGTRAPIALLEAQRWWTVEGAQAFAAEVAREGAAKVLTRFENELGGIARDALVATLGPISEGPLTAEEEADVCRALLRPWVWAGLRFVGVDERRPIRPWDPDFETPPSENAVDAFRERCIAITRGNAQ